MGVPLTNPQPDFIEFESVLKGEKEPHKVHLVEISVDREVIEYITENVMGKKFFYREAEKVRRAKIQTFDKGEGITPLTDKIERAYYKQWVEFYYRMGYDYFPETGLAKYLSSIVRPKVKKALDTAVLPRVGGYLSPDVREGYREWVDETVGLISSWEDVDKFPWDRIRLELDNYFEFFSENIPKGMKVMVVGALYEQVLQNLLGYENLFYLLHDDPGLVEEVSNRWGEVTHRFYEDVIEKEVVGGIFHSADLGYKTGTMVAPGVLRKMFFPWLTKYASLTHEHGKMFWLHSCGNVLEVMPDFIADVKIDAFHSFQDAIIPVTEFKKRYQNRIATLGGVDIDKLASLDQNSLRTYIRYILEECMSGGRFALGSGNTVTNYIPVENYLTMLKEASRWPTS